MNFPNQLIPLVNWKESTIFRFDAYDFSGSKNNANQWKRPTITQWNFQPYYCRFVGEICVLDVEKNLIPFAERISLRTKGEETRKSRDYTAFSSKNAISPRVFRVISIPNFISSLHFIVFYKGSNLIASYTYTFIEYNSLNLNYSYSTILMIS